MSETIGKDSARDHWRFLAQFAVDYNRGRVVDEREIVISRAIAPTVMDSYWPLRVECEKQEARLQRDAMGRNPPAYKTVAVFDVTDNPQRRRGPLRFPIPISPREMPIITDIPHTTMSLRVWP